MMLEPVVLPSGDCAACHNDSEAMICGYCGVCPYCQSGYVTEQLKDQVEDLENEVDDLKREREILQEQLKEAQEAYAEAIDKLIESK
jgi:hypothetical protein